MRATDLHAVLENERQCYAHPWPVWVFRLGLRSGMSCWVLEVDGVVYGHAIMNFSKGWAHIMNICVAESYRGRGFGRKLLEHLLNVARNHFVHDAWLEVRPSNRVALCLYRSMGFEKVGVRKGYYRQGTERQDAVVMVAHF